MALTSVTFLGFLPLVCVAAYLTPAKVRYVWLLASSYIFYLYNPAGTLENLPALGLMLCATVISFVCTLCIGSLNKRWAKRIFLALSLLGCLGLLIACKYLNFFIEGFEVVSGMAQSRQSVGRVNFILPLGISYYTLQAVSYSIDVYNGNMRAEKNPLRYALFVSFFPSLVTGPINRATSMLPQYASPPPFDYGRVSGGLFRVLWGLFKKMVIADNIGIFTAAVFAAPDTFSGPVRIVSVLLFAYQLYADFGGCCDIAIGAARMLGFDFMENFNRPFAAKTFGALWQRWHISLTSFLRDYVFTPLVWSRFTEKLPIIGKKITRPPTTLSVLIIFTISGLWHGPNINYVIWGLLNGGIMAVASTIGKKKDKFVAKIPVYRMKHLRGFVQRILVYLMFSACLLFFCSALYSFSVTDWLNGIFSGWGEMFSPSSSFMRTLSLNGLDVTMLLVLGGSILFVEMIEMFGVTAQHNIADWIRSRAFFIRWPLYYILLLGLLFFGAFGQSQFIYQVY